MNEIAKKIENELNGWIDARHTVSSDMYSGILLGIKGVAKKLGLKVNVVNDRFVVEA